jgi:hypothetical protein
MGHELQGGGASAPSQKREIDEHRIRRRAHEIWLEEGGPEGRALDHWLRAKWELEQAPDPKDGVARLEQDLGAANHRK